MLELITVAPEHDGWVVSQASAAARHRFASGRTAEAMARQLGSAMARDGRQAEILIYLRDGSLAGKHVFGPKTLLDYP